MILSRGHDRPCQRELVCVIFDGFAQLTRMSCISDVFEKGSVRILYHSDGARLRKACLQCLSKHHDINLGSLT